MVGPSGAGKDTLIEAARRALAGSERFVFVRREITRPGDAGGEDHIPVTEDVFAARRAAGAYALAWGAHGLYYGVPTEIEAARAAGAHAVVNASRAVLDEARARLGPVRVVSVTAPVAVLAERIAARGRESAVDAAARLARAEAIAVTGPDVIEAANDGGLEEGVRRFMDALEAAAKSVSG